ncbi:outer membrane lipoprotein carrier protein LolA [Erythrobacteraceae bacterium CFH 75059]|uniref:LolA family protein n=1 Tax=Qipengyuania thermophila TaxID=2509361 RepID=UPI001021FC36|nr:outer membrane lipoprotein carrier protein LolA [Qipengyuania thermophila]TCD06941.1 outer membrane lipoprotein carrier protein LolA [Erythrobacteraceae bacterium CFH 75059]
MTTHFLNTSRVLPLAAALAVAVPAAHVLLPAPATAQTANPVNEAAAALRAISTMRADFTQTDRSGQTLRGVLSLKRPGKIRFEYAPGTNMLVVSNGQSLYMVDYDVAQVQRWPISNSPLGALLDPSRDVSRYGRAVDTGNPNVLSIEVRDPRRPEFGVITLIFVRDAAAPGGLRLTHWVALDAQNNRTTVRLSNQRFGMAIADSTFTFRDPRRGAARGS